MSAPGVPDRVSSYGSLFSYALWTPGTRVDFFRVPWDMTYRDVVMFDDPDGMNKWLDDAKGKGSITINKLSYAKPNSPIKVDMPFNIANHFNYLRVRNPMQPITSSFEWEMSGITELMADDPQDFYYFITDIQYSAPNTTIINVQLDVWQTYRKHLSFSSGYIERSHAVMCMPDEFAEYGQRYLTVPEGLDLGGDYKVVHTVHETVGASGLTFSGNQDSTRFTTNMTFEVLVAASTDLLADPGTMDAPNLKTAEGSQFENLPHGCSYYLFTGANFNKFAKYISSYPWIAQGIQSIMAVPPEMVLEHQCDAATITRGGYNIPVQVLGLGYTQTAEWWGMKDFRQKCYNYLPERYRTLKKFLVSPYTLVEFTTYTGTPLILKPELINSPHVEALMYVHLSHPSPRISFVPLNYNTDKPAFKVGESTKFDWGESLDMQTGFFNFPTFSIVNNGYIQYMAANRNSIAYGYSSADWTQQRAMASNQLSYNQASAGIDMANQMTALSIGGMNASTGLANDVTTQRGILKGANAAADGIITATTAANPMGILGGVVAGTRGIANAYADTNITLHAQTEQNAINTALAGARNSVATANQGYVRDTNKAYADWAAQGDYQNTIAGLNAKVQDAKMLQPTIAGQSGGDAFLLATFGWRLVTKVKMPPPGVISAIGDYWLRFGYAVNRYFKGRKDGVIDLTPMSKFTYWKMREVYVHNNTSVPENFRQTFRGIMEKGVTIWVSPDDVGVTDHADNTPRRNFSL